MPPRKYTPTQKAALAVVAAVHAEHIDKKLKLRQAIQQAFEDSMIDLELKKSRAMNDALGLGVAKTDIGRAIGTANFQTVKDLLARTVNDVSVQDLAPAAPRFEHLADRNMLRVTMAGADYDAWKIENKSKFRGAAAERDTAVFYIRDGAPSQKSTSSLDYSTGNTYDLAVTGWLRTDGHREACEWIAANVTEAHA